MFRRSAVAAVLVTGLLSACGSDKSDDSATTKAAAPPAATAPATAPAATPTTPAATTPTTPAATTPTATKVDKKQIIAQCHAALDPYVDGLRDLDAAAKVATGLTSYNAAVSKALGGRQNINFAAGPKTSSACLQTVFVYSTAALTHYVAATTTWADCAKRDGCSTASISSRLRKEWATGHSYVNKAESGFRKTGPAPSNVPPTS